MEALNPLCGGVKLEIGLFDDLAGDM